MHKKKKVIDLVDAQGTDRFVIDVQARNGYSLDQSPAPLGFQMTLTTSGLLPGINTTSDEMVSITAPYVTTLNGSYAAINGWLPQIVGVKAEHPNVLTDLGGGMTRYVSYESYYEVSAVLLEFCWVGISIPAHACLGPSFPFRALVCCSPPAGSQLPDRSCPRTIADHRGTQRW